MAFPFPDDVIVDFAFDCSEQGPGTALLPCDLVPDCTFDACGLNADPEIGHLTEPCDTGFPYPDCSFDDGSFECPTCCIADLADASAAPDSAASDDGAEKSAESPVFPLALRPPRRPAFLTSALVHGTFLFLTAVVPVTNVGGNTGGLGNVITLKVVSQEDVVPQDESPGSIDSGASMPSIAKQGEYREQQPVEPSEQPAEKELSTKPDDNPDGDSAIDSVASTPSVASAAREFIPAGGHESNIFDTMILSAIRESVFFPKDALNRRHHGQVTVTFAVTREGFITDLRISAGSDSMILNDAAIKIVEKAAKRFPPIPESVRRDRLEYVVPILFKEKRGS